MPRGVLLSLVYLLYLQSGTRALEDSSDKLVFWEDVCQSAAFSSKAYVPMYMRIVIAGNRFSDSHYFSCSFQLTAVRARSMYVQVSPYQNLNISYGKNSVDIRPGKPGEHTPIRDCPSNLGCQYLPTFGFGVKISLEGVYNDLKNIDVVAVQLNADRPCEPGHVRCETLKVCVPDDWLCKGLFDCPHHDNQLKGCDGQLPDVPDFAQENPRLSNASLPDHRNYHTIHQNVNKVGWLVVSLSVLFLMCITVIWSIHFIRKRRTTLQLRMMQQLEQLTHDAQRYPFRGVPPPIYIPKPLPDYSTLPQPNELPPPYTPGTQETSGLLSHAVDNPEDTPPPYEGNRGLPCVAGQCRGVYPCSRPEGVPQVIPCTCNGPPPQIRILCNVFNGNSPASACSGHMTELRNTACYVMTIPSATLDPRTGPTHTDTSSRAAHAPEGTPSTQPSTQPAPDAQASVTVENSPDRSTGSRPCTGHCEDHPSNRIETVEIESFAGLV